MSCFAGSDTQEVFEEPLDLPFWTVEGPLVTIGAVDDSVYAFGVVQGLDVGPDGLVYSGLALGAVQARVREATFAPSFLPPVDEMVIAADGDIWLRRSSLGVEDRE